MKPRFAVATSVALLSVSLLGSLILMSAAIQNSGRFGALFSVLLVTNLLGLAAFAGLIVINVLDLLRQLRARRPGSRLTLRMLLIFVALAVLPIAVLYGFSINLLTRGVDSWFDVRIDDALEDALELSRRALDLRTREVLSQTEKIAEELGRGFETSSVLDLDALRNPGSTIVADAWAPGQGDLDLLRRRAGAEELAIVTPQGRLIESSSSGTDLVPNLPSAAVLLQVTQGHSYTGLEPIGSAGLYLRVAVTVPHGSPARGGRILQALYPVAARMDELATSVENAYAKYDELAYLREKLKLSFAMTLTLVLLSSVATAIWIAFFSARRLAAPISDLAAGTAAVAAGHYDTILPVTTADDLGFLVGSFNAMTRRIALARDEVEAQHRYLNTLLAQLSSGVLALDAEGRITTLNDAGHRILDLGDANIAHEPLSALGSQREHLRPFIEGVRQLAQSAQRWEQEIQLFGRGGRRVLMCRGSSLPTEGAGNAGHVVVFDDVTALIQGQRDAAWSEVARRLAHEIKNPLTPIQLSAERLRQKYLARMAPADAETLDRLTTTIVQQVDTMKSMVNTFSDYARAPAINQAKTDLNRLIAGVVDLYRNANQDAEFELDFDPELPPASVDAGRIRQVFNNLIKNALESAAGTGSPPHVRITTRRLSSADGEHLELAVADRGEGVPAHLMANVFEPYVTNKTKGTGLGLAIVKKIVEEHGGLVTLANNVGPGACATIRLPLDGKESPGEATVSRRAS
jgi:nitrogen fixation/metabolism regulation signal transduction histidine kinase